MLWILLIGFVIGIIVKDPEGMIISLLLGVFGSWWAYMLGIRAGWYQGVGPLAYLCSIFGALIIIFSYRVYFGTTFNNVSRK